MKLIAHISDLHFGREEPGVTAALLGDLHAATPHLVVASGDLTQRARPVEFRAARTFLDRLPAPWLAVPGNHDVPLYNLVRRFLRPHEHYCNIIHDELFPMHVDDEIAVVGVNTSRAFAGKGGRVSYQQMACVERALGPLPDSLVKVVVTHHQFLPAPADLDDEPVGRAAATLHALARSGVDLMLAGHLHRGYHGDVKLHYPGVPRSIISVQCGTSTSCRRRGEPNGYNLIAAERRRITVMHRQWDGGLFRTISTTVWRRKHGDWTTTTVSVAEEPSAPAPSC